MQHRKIWKSMAFAVLAIISTVTIAERNSAEITTHGWSPWHLETIKVDVAESMPKFIFDEAPLLPSGMPAYGNPFITQGYIYPYGTLEGGNGVLADGSPEFPDLVIGEWTCRGYMIGNGAETTTGPWVITTQLYDFYDEAGFAAGKQTSRQNLVTEGYEIADVGVKSTRAVTGGTGKYQHVQGQATQTLLGFNASEGVNLRLKMRVK